MHFTTRSAPTVQPTIGFLPGHPVYPLSLPFRRLTPDYVQLDARRPPSASGELISVISRSCNLSRLLHGQLIIIAIPISGVIRRTARRADSRTGNRSCKEREAIPMLLLAADGISGIALLSIPDHSSRLRFARAHATGQLLLRHPSCISRRMTSPEINSYKLAWIDKEVSTWPFFLCPAISQNRFSSLFPTHLRITGEIPFSHWISRPFEV